MQKTFSSNESRAEIERRIAALTPESPRRWGTMSVPGMLCHLTDSYELPLGERPAAHIAIPAPRMVKWVALHSPLPWPHNLQTLPEVRQGEGGSAPASVADEQQRLLAILARFYASPRLGAVPHPIFGAMSAAEWMRWGYLHAHHHLRQFSA